MQDAQQPRTDVSSDSTPRSDPKIRSVAHRLSFASADCKPSLQRLEALPKQDCITPESLVTITAEHGIAENTGRLYS